jgi:hypothetical protein
MVEVNANGGFIPASENQHSKEGPANIPESTKKLASPQGNPGAAPAKKKAVVTGKSGSSANPNQRSIASFFSKK